MEKRTFVVLLLIDSMLNGDIHNVPGKAYNNEVKPSIRGAQLGPDGGGECDH